MRRIFLFMNVSVDGYFEAPGHDLSWAKNDFEAFSPGESQETDTILLGHRTYEMMKNFWPTPQAAQVAPEIAKFMNEKLKVVASHKPFEPGWKNAMVVSGDVAGAVRKLKEGPGMGIIMLGSNTLCASLMPEGLIDEFQILVNPVALGEGTSLFKGLSKKVDLTLAETRTFKSGSILLTYRAG
jgi:dihydrofolate reductase